MARSAICIDADTGLVYYEEEASIQRPPASMAKLILMLLIAEGLEQGAWTPTTPITASAHAQYMGGTQVFLKEGETHPLEKMMEAVAVASANDAAMAVAEGLWGSETAYLAAANHRAAQLGMTSTVFRSVHGLPPDRGEEPDQTTARDMALLARACVASETVMKWAGIHEFEFRPGKGVYKNTNRLLRRMDDCDGLKTGYIRLAGFCVTATACRDNMRLIAVVMGAPSNTERFRQAEELLERGFASAHRLRLAEKETYVGRAVPVTNSAISKVWVSVSDDLWVTVPDSAVSRVELVPVLPDSVAAPLAAGTPIGAMEAWLGGKLLAKVPLRLPRDLRVE